MKVALVLTVKNERRLLRNNLLYHHAKGVSKAFVYFDGTTDDGKDTIKDLSFVEIGDSISEKTYESLEFLHAFNYHAAEHHTARQCLNTFDATEKCKTLGYDWLISLDADELIVPDLEGNTDLLSFFLQMPPDVEVVNFRVKEILQTQLSATNIFAEAKAFKNRRNIKFTRQLVSKSIYNPFLNTMESFSFWYGHTMGKGAINIHADLVPHNVHRFKHKNKMPAKTISCGFIFHYHSYDFDDFIKKFENFKHHPDVFLSGNSVERLKLLWRDIVNSHTFSKDELKQYYEQNVMFSSQELGMLNKRFPFCFFPPTSRPVILSTAVTNVFKNHIPMNLGS